MLPTQDGEPIWTQLNAFLNVTGSFEIIVDLKKCVCWGVGVWIKVNSKDICISRVLGKVSSNALMFDCKMLY